MADAYREGGKCPRNIYKINPNAVDRLHDEHVAVAFDPAFGPKIVEALNRWEDDGGATPSTDTVHTVSTGDASPAVDGPQPWGLADGTPPPSAV